MGDVTVKATLIGKYNPDGSLDREKTEIFIRQMTETDEPVLYTKIIQILYERFAWLYGAGPEACLKMHWIDPDGDIVTICSNEDMTSCVRVGGPNVNITITLEPRRPTDKVLCDHCRLDVVEVAEQLQVAALNAAAVVGVAAAAAVNGAADVASPNASINSTESNDSVVDSLLKHYKHNKRDNVAE